MFRVVAVENNLFVLAITLVTLCTGPISQRDLSTDLDLNLRLWSVDLTLSLGGSGLKFCEEDLNMASINFSPLQNLKLL